MFKETCISLDHPVAWRNALKGIKHGYAHTWDNCYAMHLTTGFPTYLYSFENDSARILCPIAERKYGNHVDIVTPFGYSGFIGNQPCSDFPNYWKDFVERKGYVCGYIGMNPFLKEESYYNFEDVNRYNSLYALDLTLSISELFSNLSRNRKRELRNWEQDFSTIITDKETLKGFFIDNYHACYRNRNASETYNFSQQTLNCLISSENVLLVGVRISGKIIAAKLCTFTADVADLLLNVSFLEGKQFNSLMTWYNVIYLKSIGVPILNMGGGLKEDDKYMLAKKNFGAKRFPLECLKQVYIPQVFNQLVREKYLDSNSSDAYFPPFHQPKLMRDLSEDEAVLH